MLGNAQYSRTYGAPAANVRAEFFMDTVEDRRASIDAGRPVFREIESVKVIIPGLIASVVVHRVNEEHRQRWPEQYAAFKAGQDPVLNGTPLEEWPILNKAAISELRHAQIRTVEELAALSDIAVQGIGMGGQVLRERARGWLDDAQHEAFTNRLLHDNDLLRSEVGALKTQNEELSRHLTLVSARIGALEERRGGFATLVPGEADPFERAKTEPPRVTSAIDQLAAQGARPRRARRGEPGPLDGEAAETAT
jgi:hypothetical protein